MTYKISGWMPIRTIACMAVFSIAAAAGAQKSDWKSYSYPADGFQANYPSVPELTKKDIPTEAGSFQLHTYLAEIGSAALNISVCDFGPKPPQKTPEEILEGTKNAALQNSSSHILREKKITLGNYPGLEFQAQSENALVTARIYLVGNLMYETLVVAPLGKPFPDTTRFLDSFQLIAKAAN